jgi:hypothetical protein
MICIAAIVAEWRDVLGDGAVPLDSFGKMLLMVGILIAAIGVVFMLAGRVPFLGSLPGDPSFERDGVRVYVPIMTSIVLSIVLTVLLNVVFGLFGRR